LHRVSQKRSVFYGQREQGSTRRFWRWFQGFAGGETDKRAAYCPETFEVVEGEEGLVGGWRGTGKRRYKEMRKSIFVIFGVLLICSILFAERVKSEYADYEYKNRDGTLDWKTFYDEWDTVPNSYYMYLNVYSSSKRHGVEPYKMLAKEIGDMLSNAFGDHTQDNDIHFILREWLSETSHHTYTYYNVEIIFSPWNYQDAKKRDWIPLGQKRNNYNDAIERWNFTINQF